mgnify:CR=1 FL=1
MIDRLTRDLADKAWKLIEEVEALGGMAKAIGELCGCVSATGCDIKAFCVGPLYALLYAFSLVKARVFQRVAVVGGGDSATQESLYLAKIAKEVHLIHRRQELRATECIQEECFLNPDITMHLSWVLEEIVGEGGRVSAVRLRSTETGEHRTIPVDGVFEFVGIDAQSSLVAHLCELDERGFVKVDRNGLTSHPGLYAAGDICDYDLKQVVTACARGAFAVYHAVHYLETRICNM